jgi:hypothetical protein
MESSYTVKAAVRSLLRLPPWDRIDGSPTLRQLFVCPPDVEDAALDVFSNIGNGIEACKMPGTHGRDLPPSIS